MNKGWQDPWPPDDAEPPDCECGGEVELVTGDEIYRRRPDLAELVFWRCGCGRYVGCHPGTTNALGSPADWATRQARNEAHSTFDLLWKRKHMSRSKAYRWLGQQLEHPNPHIGAMTADEARVVEQVSRRYLASAGELDW